MSTDKAMVTDSPMQFFSENVDRWGAAEWFDRLAKAIRAQDEACGLMHRAAKEDKWAYEASLETYRNIAASSAMRLVRDYEQQVRAALLAALSEAEQQPVAGPSLGWKPANSSPRRFLLLASYCGEDNDQCTDKSPCPECLAMCNIYDEDSQYRGTLAHPPAKREAGEAAAPVQDVVPTELLDRTFAVQHNPRCPSAWLVRLPGKSGAIDLKPYGDRVFNVPHQTGDILGFGKTFEEAARAALATTEGSDNG